MYLPQVSHQCLQSKIITFSLQFEYEQHAKLEIDTGVSVGNLCRFDSFNRPTYFEVIFFSGLRAG